MSPEEILAARRIVRPFRGEGLTPATHAARAEGRGRPLTDQPPQRGVPRDRVVTVVDQQLRPTDSAARQAEYAKRKAKRMKGNDHG